MCSVFCRNYNLKCITVYNKHIMIFSIFIYQSGEKTLHIIHILESRFESLERVSTIGVNDKKGEGGEGIKSITST